MTEPDYQFEFIDEQSALEIDFERMKRAISCILADEGYVRAKLELVALDAEPMHELNVQFLGHDYPTDVLAFPNAVDPDSGTLEGEIVVCPDVAIEYAKDYVAKDYAWSPEDETLLYAIHGALHLVGYDDHSPEDAPIMHAKEREYLARVGVDGSRSRAGEENA